MNTLELIDEEVQLALLEKARASDRRRAHRLYHSGPDDPVQRMLIAVLPDSYVPPHRHPAADKWEWLQLVSGSLTLLLFDDQGEVTVRQELQAAGQVSGSQLAANQWHAIVAQEPCIFMEIKPGPFVAENAAEFTDWAPQEGHQGAQAALNWLRQAQVGERYRAP